MPKSTYFQIYYCSKNKMYDFTIFNSHTKEVIYHHHFSNLNNMKTIELKETDAMFVKHVLKMYAKKTQGLDREDRDEIIEIANMF